MDTVVNKLLDVDRDARRILDDAQQYYDKTMEEIEAEKKKMIAYFEEKERKHLEGVKESEDGNVSSENQNIQKRYSALTEKLNAAFEKSHAEWENELFERCVRA